jgi:CBS domain-containing protein
MSRHNIGALVVTEGPQVVGIISERDYARKVILIGKTSRDTRVREIMSSPARTVTPQTTVAECFGYMTDNRLRHLPVVDGTDLIGVLSIGDLVKFIMEAQELRLEQFEKYVQGNYPN